VIIL
jgi:hypothetical protein